MLIGLFQVCIAIKRIYVHSSIYDTFMKELVAYVQGLIVGNGMDKASTTGPVQNAMQYRKIQCLVESIKADGLRVVTNNLDRAFSNDRGYFIEPIVVDNPPDDSQIVTQEPFGKRTYFHN